MDIPLLLNAFPCTQASNKPVLRAPPNFHKSTYVFEFHILPLEVYRFLPIAISIHTCQTMVVGRVLRAARCPNCRISIFRSFASLHGLPIRTAHPSARLQYSSTGSKARFSSSAVQDGDGHRFSDEAHGRSIVAEVSQEADDAEDTPHKEEVSTVVSAVPWYLQVDTPQRMPQTLSERQRIPDLPEHPPPILQSLLQQLSIDLGLDNLSLLDLRKLDPPPALGANLMMVIGTARSEKHLHVSADRLCRWLRSTYNLRPEADGLLGRNELKLKLRRKARRAKLVGSVAEDNDDDGVRTGWVCVDAGVVDSPEPSTDAETRNFVGFGRRTDGVRMVVQMLTDEKREEIDLEGLWGGILERGTKRQIQETETLDSSQSSTLKAIPGKGQLHSKPPSFIASQSRGFHTSAYCLSDQIRAQSSTASAVPGGADIKPPSNNLREQYLQRHLMEAFASGNFNLNEASFLPFSQDFLGLQNDGWRAVLLQQLQEYLESVPKDTALQLLGTGDRDNATTPFVACFYRAVPTFLSQTEGKAIIDFYCYAMEIGHTRYKIEGLLSLVSKMVLRGIPISSNSFLRLLRNVLPRGSWGVTALTKAASIDGAMILLRVMHDQGHKVLTEEVFLLFQEALTSEVYPGDSKPAKPTATTFDLPSNQTSPRQHRLHLTMLAVDMPFFSDETRLRLLELYARMQYWREFWDVWRMAPRRGQPQSPPMYALMFRKIAETKNQKACIAVLRTWVPEMDAETPKVALEGEVAEAVRAVLEVAEPLVQEEAARNPGGRGEWIDLWRRTMQGGSFSPVR